MAIKITLMFIIQTIHVVVCMVC